MNKYEEAGNSERLYGEELPLPQEEDFDARMTGIRLLGRDMAKISDPQTFRIIKSILDGEIEDVSQYKLVSDMIRESGSLQARFGEILSRLEKLTPLLHKDVVESTACPHQKAVSTFLRITSKGHSWIDPGDDIDLTAIPLWVRV